MQSAFPNALAGGASNTSASTPRGVGQQMVINVADSDDEGESDAAIAWRMQEGEQQ